MTKRREKPLVLPRAISFLESRDGWNCHCQDCVKMAKHEQKNVLRALKAAGYEIVRKR